MYHNVSLTGYKLNFKGNINKEIEKVLKQARLNKKITQEQLAEALGVTTQGPSSFSLA